jgi:hypothetical protein
MVIWVGAAMIASCIARSPDGAKTVCPSLNEATRPRCDCEGYPDRPGRASSKEGES